MTTIIENIENICLFSPSPSVMIALKAICIPQMLPRLFRSQNLFMQAVLIVRIRVEEWRV